MKALTIFFVSLGVIFFLLTFRFLAGFYVFLFLLILFIMLFRKALKTDTLMPSVDKFLAAVEINVNKAAYYLKTFFLRFNFKKLLLGSFITVVLVAGIIALTIFLTKDYFKERSTKKEMTQLKEELEQFKNTKKLYPNSLSELIGSYPLKRDLHNDQWNNPYYYSVTRQGTDYSLKSSGPDQTMNTNDDLVIE